MKKILVIIILLLLTGCTPLVEKVDRGKYAEYNELGLEAMNNGNIEEAVDLFKQAIEEDPTIDDAYNNIGWAYNELEEYDKALRILKKALEIQENSTYEYSNIANTYIALDMYDEAKINYKLAIEEDKSNGYAHYGLAVIYRDEGDYTASMNSYIQAIKYNKDDLDIKYSRLDCMSYFGEYLAANAYADDLIFKYPDYYDFHELKGQILQEIDNEANIVKYYEQLTEKFSDVAAAASELGKYYFNLGNFEHALSEFTAIENKDYDLNVWLFFTERALGNIDEAKKIAGDLIKEAPEKSEGHNAMGLILSDETDFIAAVDYYKTALLYATDNTPAFNILNALNNAQRYLQVINLKKDILDDYPNSTDIISEIAYAYYMRNDYLDCIEFLKFYEDSNNYLSGYDYYIAECYYALNDFNQSKAYIEKYLEDYPNDDSALTLYDSIVVNEHADLNMIESLFNEYYLLDYNQKAFNTFTDPLSDIKAHQLLDQVKDTEDPYTFVISGDGYDYIVDETNNRLITDVIDGYHYVRFDRFDNSIDHLFIEFIDAIEDSKDKELIIDLRFNGGGMTDSANNILNVLLDDILISQLITKDGYTYPYYSDKSMIEFKNIYVLTSNDTASASELLTLGLKTYLDNVTVVGNTTYGKGTGQHVYEDKINKRYYFILNHFWNVREQNISDIGILPDIKIISDDLSDFMNAVKNSHQ